jgi:hypothetical protein
MKKSWNPAINLAREHLEMRQMIEPLIDGSITYNGWIRKYKNFICDPYVEMYVNDVLHADEMFTRQIPLRRQH